jgi:protoporphyrinogen oxidase
MDSVSTLIVGAGISGLATAAFGRDPHCVILEADREIGGYCKTVKRDGFTWDYSGHFFHFKHPDIEAWLRERMPGQTIRTVTKRSLIHYKGQLVDFPFQKNIHQLPREDFIDCLHDLYFAAHGTAPTTPASFKDMLYARLGRSIAEKFLIPYNEKLYACDLGTLDQDAMGRFFPHANMADIVRNMKTPDSSSYNATFTYPEGGAIEYVKALAAAAPAGSTALDEPLVSVDLGRKIARTSKRELRFERLVSSAPLSRFAKLCALPHDQRVFTWNKVLVFNLGFDRKGPRDVHWIYYPDRDLVFYRVGFYDNIFETQRMSLYVEIGFPRDAEIDVAATRTRVLVDLARAGVIKDHQLVAEHHVIMDPAYVHITRDSLAETARIRAELAKSNVHSIGRYGGWTYCSIEDNIVEARGLAAG